MRVLVFSQYFWPENFRINEVVDLLRNCGCDVVILTGQPNYPDGVIADGYSACSFGLDRRDDGLEIFRVPLVPRGAGGASALFLNYISFIFSAAFFGPWLLRHHHIDVILVYAPSPILQAIPAIWLSRLKRAKLVTWVQDLWPDSLSATGFIQNSRALAIVASIVRWIYRKNDLLLVQSRAFVRPVEDMSACTPVVYHPNPGELSFLNANVGREPVVMLDGLKFNIIFAGNLGVAQALDTVLNAAKLLNHLEDVRFCFVGEGSRSQWLKDEIDRLNLRNVKMLGRFPSCAMPGIFAQASALLVSLIKDPMISLTVPSKVQSYLAAGKPIIASMDGEGARIVVEAGAGIACAAEDAVALADAVIRLRSASPKHLKDMSVNGQSFYKQNFEPNFLAMKLVRMLSTLVVGEPSFCMTSKK